MTLEWLRNGQAITGATTSTYEVRAQDVGASLAVRFTGRVDGWIGRHRNEHCGDRTPRGCPDGTTLLAPDGTGRVGTSLTAPTAAGRRRCRSRRTSWLRDGQPIAGATGTTYTVATADVVRLIAVRITATARLAGPPARPRPGRSPAGRPRDAAAPTESDPDHPTPTPTTPVRPPRRRPDRRRRSRRGPCHRAEEGGCRKLAVVTVKVTAAGGVPIGAVKIYAGSKVVGTVTLKASSNGVVKVSSAKIAKGRYKLRAVYAGSAGVGGSSSAKVTLVVR